MAETIRTTDYLVIGAGITGVMLASELGCPVLDRAPGGYKVGESVIPEQFHDPRMARHLEAVRALPTWSPKLGTVFMDADEVAVFPLAQHRQRAMHVARHELESLLMARTGVDVVDQEVLELDVPGRRVRTAAGWWQSRGPLLDCSGPAMLVANALDEVESLGPIWATWGYHDVIQRDADAFWRQVEQAGRHSTALDVPSGRLLEGPEGREDPSSCTNLVRVDDGLWMWHIPLCDRQVLSVGVVSRRGPVDAARYQALVTQSTTPMWRLQPRLQEAADIPGAEPLRGLRHRHGFAKRARRAAGENFVLVGDAFAFGDPVYSVGTGLAVTQALDLAERLQRRPWSPEEARAFHQQSELKLERALEAFEFWYSGRVIRDERAAQLVQDGFLVGESFRLASYAAYSHVVEDASQAAESPILRALSETIAGEALLAKLRLRTEPSEGSVLLAGEALTLEVIERRPDASAYKWIGEVGVSYQTLNGEAAPLPQLDALSAVIERDPWPWLRGLRRLRGLRDVP